jgi:hypothetical protein
LVKGKFLPFRQIHQQRQFIWKLFFEIEFFLRPGNSPAVSSLLPSQKKH